LSLLAAPVTAEPDPEVDPGPPSFSKWLEAVRAQRQGLRQRRPRDQEPDRPALRGPVQPWKRKADRQADWMRQRQSRRALMDMERELFRNYGPWLEPLSPTPPTDGPRVGVPTDDRPDSSDAAVQPDRRHPPGWDNRWYYRGW
jgi:hypothetical protein